MTINLTEQTRQIIKLIISIIVSMGVFYICYGLLKIPMALALLISFGAFILFDN